MAIVAGAVGFNPAVGVVRLRRGGQDQLPTAGLRVDEGTAQIAVEFSFKELGHRIRSGFRAVCP